MVFNHLLAFLFLTLLIPTNSHNITAILDAFPQYSVYNSYLSQTKVCDEISTQEKITCLVLSNPVMASFVAKHSPEGIKNALRHLSLLDYFDLQRLHNLTRGTTLTATLYQSAVNVPGSGYMRITDLRGGRFGFALARPGSVLHPTYAKSVVQIPNNLSVLEISAPINFHRLPGPLSAASNLMDLLEQAGCKIFASLITSSGVLAMYRSAMDKGFTLFAPTDDAFKSPGAPDLTTLSRIDLVKFLQYHALPSYTSEASLKTTSGQITTMASNVSAEYKLSVISHGGDVFLNTGVGTARVVSTVSDDTHVCVITVESLLLPSELFSGAPAPTERDLLALTTSIPVPSTAPTPGAEAPSISGINKRPLVRPPPRRPRVPPPPPVRARSPPPPRARPPPPPRAHPPPPPPSPGAPSPDAPSPSNVAVNLVSLVDVIIASVVVISFVCL